MALPAQILLIDDSESFLFAITNAIQGALPDVEILHMSDAQKAVETLGRSQFSVIISDVCMPGMDGLEFLGHSKRLNPLAPVILMSGRDDRELAVDALRQGAYDLLTKPIEAADLVSTIRRAIEAHKLRQEYEHHRQELERSVASRTNQLNFLLRASKSLGSTLSHAEVLKKVAQLAVPEIADQCVIHMFESGHPPQAVVAVNRNDEDQEILDSLIESRGEDSSVLGYKTVSETHRPELIEHVTDAEIRKVAPNIERMELLRRLGIRSHICVPILIDGALVGTIGLATTRRSGKVYSETDIKMAEELAARTAIALENALLYEQLQTELQQRRQMEAELLDSKEAAERANLAKDRFIAILSHELRTPLTPVLPLLSLIKEEGELDEEFQGFLSIIINNVTQEARLVDDLLRVTEITAGKVRLVKDSLDIHSLIREVLQNYKTRFHEKGIIIKEKLEAAVYNLEFDPTRMRQVIGNLFENAIKFTPVNGAITICSSETDREFILQISDTGIGFDRESADRIFQTFEQASTSIHRSYGGLGLGLAISRNFVELHGGRLAATSDGIGKGAVFTLALPLTP